MLLVQLVFGLVTFLLDEALSSASFAQLLHCCIVEVLPIGLCLVAVLVSGIMKVSINKHCANILNLFSSLHQ